MDVYLDVMDIVVSYRIATTRITTAVPFWNHYDCIPGSRTSSTYFVPNDSHSSDACQRARWVSWRESGHHPTHRRMCESGSLEIQKSGNLEQSNVTLQVALRQDAKPAPKQHDLIR